MAKLRPRKPEGTNGADINKWESPPLLGAESLNRNQSVQPSGSNHASVIGVMIVVTGLFAVLAFVVATLSDGVFRHVADSISGSTQANSKFWSAVKAKDFDLAAKYFCSRDVAGMKAELVSAVGSTSVSSTKFVGGGVSDSGSLIGQVTTATETRDTTVTMKKVDREWCVSGIRSSSTTAVGG